MESALKAGVYRNYLLTVLLVLQAFNGVDAIALGLVLQNIKLDLSLSDTQLGLLSGIAFALFYSVMGMPIARWADRGNRVAIISLTAGLWSIMMALCGKATNFTQLLLIRAGLAVGESGCMPPAQSLIADYFSRSERPRALAVFLLGGSVSTLIGYFLAGWLSELYGWRMMFLMLGLPGLVPAILAWLTLKEPRRRMQTTSPGIESRGHAVIPASYQPSIRHVCTTLLTKRTFRHIILCFSVMTFFGSGILQWQPAFLIRSYGLKTGELGTWFAVIYGFGSMLGTYVGGELASRLATNNERLQLRATALVYSCFSIISALIYIVPNYHLAFALMALAAVAGSAANGPLFATIQAIVPDRMRAVAIATIYLFANLIGWGIGPLAAGALSDLLRPWAGEESLRYALLALCPGYFWGGWHLWQASKSVNGDLQAIQHEPSTESAAMPGSDDSAVRSLTLRA
jgi:MFS family permease